MKIKINLPGLLFVMMLLMFLSRSLKMDWKDWQEFEIPIKLLINDLGISFWRVSGTAIFAWVWGIVFGYFIFHIKFFSRLLLPAINFIRHISPFAWLPFAIIWFGMGEMSVGFVMFITLFFPTIIASSNQFNAVPKEFVEEAKVLGASPFQMFKFVELPLSIIGFLNLFRIIWGLGWTVIIAAEMLGVQNGMGYRLLDFRYLLQYSHMLFYLIVMGVVGILFDSLLRRIIMNFQKKLV